MAMTNFPGDAVYELETQMLLNRFRCAAQLIKSGDGSQHDHGADTHHHGAQIHEPEGIAWLRGADGVPRDTNTVDEKQDSGDHLANLAEQKQERAGEHRAGGEERHKAALEEIERRVAETIARHKLFAAGHR